ncbi:MAG: selenium-dependent xanthine dehydrogenase [Bryobacteraceae bacterium]
MPNTKFTLNGKPVTTSYEPGMTFLEVLREECGVTSAKNGCSPEGACGCCVVLDGGRPVLTCLRKPENMEGHEITTMEGLQEDLRRVLGDAFAQEGAVQCGFCIPGIVMRASHLVVEGKATDRDEITKALTGHICRCTGWQRIIDAIQTAGEAWANGHKLVSDKPRRDDYFGEQFGLKRTTEARPQGSNGVGASTIRYGSIDQALGQKKFVDDLRLPGMLNGAVVLTEHPRAKVLSIDTAEAEKMPGVVRVFTAKDVPGERGTGLAVPDLPVFVAVGETTCCIGDMFALVVADTMFHARQAAKAVKIGYEVLEPVTNPLEALKPGAPQVHCEGNLHVHPNLIDITAFSRGDVDAALASAAHVVDQVFQTQAIDPLFLEPESCVAEPQGKGVKVYSQSQGSTYDHDMVAKVLNIPTNDVEVALFSSGGSFGAKEELTIQAQTALAAHVLGTPVKTTLTRAESAKMHPKRHPMRMHVTAGCDVEGHLVALRSRIISDAGGYAGTSAKCALRAACHSGGPYKIPNVDIEAKAVFTNNPNSGAMRGFGSNQAQFAMEGVIDMLAEKVGLDGYDMRERNVLRPGEAYVTGQIMRESVGILQTLQAVKDVYKNAKYAGIGCGIKSTGLGNGTVESGNVKLVVLPGGQLQAFTGHTEMGQGLFTILRQSVVEETGIAPENIDCGWSEDMGAKSGETWASRGGTLTCAAAIDACKKLNEALKTKKLEDLAGQEFIGEYVCAFTTRPGTPEAEKNPTTHLTFSYATQVVILDDNGKLQKVVAAHDVGRAINPMACAGQVEGGVHMGLGYALTENFTATNGVPDSLKMRDCGILPAKETPHIDAILIEVPDEVGGYGAKGAGEIGLVATAGAVAGALYKFDKIRRTSIPMDDSPAAAAFVPKGRKKKVPAKVTA